MSKGQKAMVIAMALSETNKTQEEAARETGVSQQRIHLARTVLKHTPDLAKEVPNGQDPIAFILSVNYARRHMSQGQKAMIAAFARSLLETD